MNVDIDVELVSPVAVEPSTDDGDVTTTVESGFAIDAAITSVGVEIETPGVDIGTPDPSVPVLVVATPGAQGPRGPAGDGGFTHIQDTPAATWTIPNQLSRMPAGVLIVVDGEVVEADVIPSVDTIVVVFASPQAGQAEIV